MPALLISGEVLMANGAAGPIPFWGIGQPGRLRLLVFVWRLAERTRSVITK
jgi:hypothetical protein